jgi:hypothetical protein
VKRAVRKCAVVLLPSLAWSCGDAADQAAEDADSSGGGVVSVTASAGELLDVGGGGASGGNGGDCPGGGPGAGEYEFSFIWIANSPQGTVSKVNTFTGVEEGRYRTGPGEPDPSRTSVNQFGDVAVANRNGGITKIAARLDACRDRDGDGTIQTSTGPQDILDWGDDECVLWHQDLPAQGSDGPRPVAWEPVNSNCSSTGPRVWVGYYSGTDQDVGIFRRLDGSTGDTLDEIEVPVWNLADKPTGPYGGAVNAAGDFWVTGYYGPAIRIDAETLEVEWFEPPDQSGFYGMALDVDENIWIGGCDGVIYRFDQAAQTFENIAPVEGRARGVQVDDAGRAWFAGNNPCRLIAVDTVTKQVIDDDIDLPGCGEPVGVSIDVEGYVWVVDKNAEQAYKVDPETYEIVTIVTGLVDPYTYSDMTGHGLGLVAGPPAG